MSRNKLTATVATLAPGRRYSRQITLRKSLFSVNPILPGLFFVSEPGGSKRFKALAMRLGTFVARH